MKGTTAMADATVKDVKEFFGMKDIKDMKYEWMGKDIPGGDPDKYPPLREDQKLTKLDKAEILAGLGDGTFNYDRYKEKTS
jgi:hypothetical protein